LLFYYIYSVFNPCNSLLRDDSVQLEETHRVINWIKKNSFVSLNTVVNIVNNGKRN